MLRMGNAAVKVLIFLEFMACLAPVSRVPVLYLRNTLRFQHQDRRLEPRRGCHMGGVVLIYQMHFSN